MFFIFPKAYLILSLAILSLAQLDIHDLFQVDISTNNEGGCNYVNTIGFNYLLQDCLQLADSFIAAIDDSSNPLSPFIVPAYNLLDAFFKPSDLNDINILKGI